MGFKSGFVKCLFLSLMILFVGCAELTSLREEKVLMTQRIDELQSENDNLNNKYAVSEGENARLIQERNRLENTRRSMEQRLTGTGVNVKIKEGHISVVLPSSVLFNSGQTKLKKSAKNSLSKVCAVLKKDFPNDTIRIEGHTDSDPIKRTKQVYKSNWELSAMRATTVLHHLIDNCHLDPKKLYLAGFGKYQSVASNKTKSGKRKNRRVEIVVLTD
ncbi:MAG: OmpA/MotB family protein [Planctomycetota bacterium]